MSPLDLLLVGGAVLFALFARPRSMVSAGVLALLVAGCVAQAWLEGFYWQFLPVYVVLALLLVRPRPGWRVHAVRACRMTAVAALAASWVFLPVPELPAPRGPYAVGTEVYRWVDAARPEPATDAPDDLRNLVVQAWYPAARGTTGMHSAYIDGLGRLPDFVSVVPRAAMAQYGRIDTHAVVEAPVAADRRRWPVVLFSPGYGAARAFYTTLVTDLASRGFVVLAVDHPYEAAVTQLADGRLAMPVEHFAADDPDRTAYMSEHLEIRAADLRSVLDRVTRPGGLGPLSERLDRDRIAAIGHSFGGAAAVALMAGDGRIKAAANIDGTLYGTLAERRLDRPFLLIESDHGETGHSALYLRGNGRLIANLRAGGERYQITGANHYSFTDAPLLVAPPVRWLAAWLLGGSRGPVQTLHATNDIVTAFLQGGSPADVRAAASRYPRIAGGAVAVQASGGASETR